MFWRVRADLSFDSEDEARDFYHDCELALPKSTTINPGTPAQESGFIQHEKCFHDIDPSEPCIELDYQGTTV